MAFEQVLEQLEGRLTGVREEGERIKLHIMPLEECWHSTPDCEPLLPHAARTPTMIRQEQEGEQEGEEEGEEEEEEVVVVTQVVVGGCFGDGGDARILQESRVT